MNETFMKEIIQGNLKLAKAFEIIVNGTQMDSEATEYDVVFEHNKMRLLRFKPLVKKEFHPPLLMVYAVINRPYILDLQQDRSVVKKFLEKGFDVYLIDWGTPSDADKYTCLDDYINYYMRYAVDHICKENTCTQISLLGYCIGGYFASIFSSLYPKRVKNLMIMSAPIDFHVKGGPLHVWTQKDIFDVSRFTEAYGNCTPDILNNGFMLLNPMENTYLKYLDLVEKVDNKDYVDNFFRMEKWINDGISIPARFFVEWIRDGYQENKLVKGELKVAGKPVNLNKITMPLLLIVGKVDNLVPPASTLGLLSHVKSKDTKVFENPSGHIGVSVGGKAHRVMWPEVIKWLAKHSEK
ncbi:MAG: class III poly(R)-hydroxyalkanoic acid synthase subunit PhaC [Thermoplasmata archaeon]|nr:class III poly(R)-hydroxyalkanoic acid synthase subunit PhaC [Thermoplasmata archaeon]